MKRAKQVLALLLSLALLLGLCGLAEEPVEAAEIAEAIEELIEEAPAEEAEAPAEEELSGEEAPVEEPEEASVEEEPAEEMAEETIEAEPINADSDFVIKDGVLTKYRGEGGDVVIPDGVTVIGKGDYESIFFDVTVNSLVIPDGVQKIRCNALGNLYVKTLNIPESVTEIEQSAFCVCEDLVSIHLPSGLTTISRALFDGCTSLQTVNIPDGVTKIESGAFKDCASLKNIQLPAGLKEIGSSAFWGCKSLQSIEIGDDVQLGSQIFQDCDSLVEVVLPNAMRIYDSTFIGCDNLETVWVQSGASDDYMVSFTSTFMNCPKLKAVYVPPYCWLDDRDFEGSPNVTIYLFKGSFAETTCKNTSLHYEYRTDEPPTPPKPGSNAKVSLSFYEKTLSQKETATLKPSTTGLKKKEKYEFSTSDASIAAVSKSGGKITAKNPGTATITAKGKTSKQSATCTITVLPAPDTLAISGVTEPATLNLGGELQLGASIAPAEAPQEVTWKSSKPKIASVDKNTGLVKPLKEGKTTISATSKHKRFNGKSATAKFTLTVVDPKRPTAIHVDPETPKELVMEGGQQVTLQLKHLLEPVETAESEVTWSIPKKAHKKLASVTPQGLLTAKQAGKVQLKVTAKKKNAAGKPLSATIEITIIDPTIPESVTITEADGTQIKKGEKLTLHATCAPETAAGAELVWSSSNPKVAKVDKTTGEITAVKAGKAKITAKAKKGGKSAGITVQVIN